MIKNKAYQLNFIQKETLKKHNYTPLTEVYLSKEEAYRAALKATATGKYQKVIMKPCVLWV